MFSADVFAFATASPVRLGSEGLYDRLNGSTNSRNRSVSGMGGGHVSATRSRAQSTRHSAHFTFEGGIGRHEVPASSANTTPTTAPLGGGGVAERGPRDSMGASFRHSGDNFLNGVNIASAITLDPSPDTALCFPSPISTRTITNKLTITNSLSNVGVIFKVKTDDARRYIITPACGVVNPNDSSPITITLKRQPEELSYERLAQWSDTQKFKISIVPYPVEDADGETNSPTTASDMWHLCQRYPTEMEFMLECDFLQSYDDGLVSFAAAVSVDEVAEGSDAADIGGADAVNKGSPSMAASEGTPSSPNFRSSSVSPRQASSSSPIQSARTPRLKAPLPVLGELPSNVTVDATAYHNKRATTTILTESNLSSTMGSGVGGNTLRSTTTDAHLTVSGVHGVMSAMPQSPYGSVGNFDDGGFEVVEHQNYHDGREGSSEAPAPPTVYDYQTTPRMVSLIRSTSHATIGDAAAGTTSPQLLAGSGAVGLGGSMISGQLAAATDDNTTETPLSKSPEADYLGTTASGRHATFVLDTIHESNNEEQQHLHADGEAHDDPHSSTIGSLSPTHNPARYHQLTREDIMVRYHGGAGGARVTKEEVGADTRQGSTEADGGVLATAPMTPHYHHDSSVDGNNAEEHVRMRAFMRRYGALLRASENDNVASGDDDHNTHHAHQITFDDYVNYLAFYCYALRLGVTEALRRAQHDVPQLIADCHVRLHDAALAATTTAVTVTDDYSASTAALDALDEGGVVDLCTRRRRNAKIDRLKAFAGRAYLSASHRAIEGGSAIRSRSLVVRSQISDRAAVIAHRAEPFTSSARASYTHCKEQCGTRLHSFKVGLEHQFAAAIATPWLAAIGVRVQVQLTGVYARCSDSLRRNRSRNTVESDGAPRSNETTVATASSACSCVCTCGAYHPTGVAGIVAAPSLQQRESRLLRCVNSVGLVIDKAIDHPAFVPVMCTAAVGVAAVIVTAKVVAQHYEARAAANTAYLTQYGRGASVGGGRGGYRPSRIRIVGDTPTYVRVNTPGNVAVY